MMPLDREIETLETRLSALYDVRHRTTHQRVQYRRPSRDHRTVMTVDDYRRLWVAGRSLRNTDEWRRYVEAVAARHIAA